MLQALKELAWIRIVVQSGRMDEQGEVVLPIDFDRLAPVPLPSRSRSSTLPAIGVQCTARQDEHERVTLWLRRANVPGLVFV